MIPLPQIIAELMMALGAALVVAMVLVLVRMRRGTLDPNRPVPSKGRAITNLLIGVLVFVWAFASFVTSGASAR